LLKLDGLDLRWEDFVVAKSGQQIIGFGRLRAIDSFLELSSLGVLDAYRHMGIASLLMAKLIARDQRNTVFLVTIIPNFFRKFGFESLQDIPDFLMPKIRYCEDALCGCGEEGGGAGEKYVAMKKNNE
jgi:N-acetylglutamate synthase-like GNAT family acetyltransferase